jgi:hypothetical protein
MRWAALCATRCAPCVMRPPPPPPPHTHTPTATRAQPRALTHAHSHVTPHLEPVAPLAGEVAPQRVKRERLDPAVVLLLDRVRLHAAPVCVARRAGGHGACGRACAGARGGTRRCVASAGWPCAPMHAQRQQRDTPWPMAQITMLPSMPLLASWPSPGSHDSAVTSRPWPLRPGPVGRQFSRLTKLPPPNLAAARAEERR